MCIFKIWSYHCGLLVQLILCMWPVSAWKCERQDIDCKSCQHTLRHHPSCSLGSFWTTTSVFNCFFLRDVSRGCKLELISITCLMMLVYCTVQVLHVDSMSRFCFNLVVLYVHMRWGDNRRQSQGCTQGEGCQAADPLPRQNLKDLDFLDII